MAPNVLAFGEGSGRTQIRTYCEEETKVRGRGVAFGVWVARQDVTIEGQKSIPPKQAETFSNSP
jgi:hypothetical protein